MSHAVVDAVTHGETDGEGGVRAVVPIESLTHADSEFLEPGDDIEGLHPAELRDRVVATAPGLDAIYRSSS